MSRKGGYIDFIMKCLGAYAYFVHAKGTLFLFDENRIAQDFFKTLLNKALGYNLTNTDFSLGANYPAIDLEDSSNRIAIQVTSESESSKIKSTLKTFNEKKFYEKYDRLIFIIIGKKQAYTTSFESNGVKFTPEEDIWDIDKLCFEIGALDTPLLEDIKNHVEYELDFLRDITVDYNHLHDQDIRDALMIFKRELEKWFNLKFDADYNISSNVITKRDSDFIHKKNDENNLSLNYFNDYIKGDLHIGTKLESFLSNPINKKFKNDYFNICNNINDFYKRDSVNYATIETLFIDIINNIHRNVEEVNIDNKNLIAILHNMYFNCDFGRLPKP